MRNLRARAAWAALTSVLAATASACASLWGFEDAVDLPDAASEASDPSVTPCNETCVPEPPTGWLGPLEIFEGTGGPPPPPPECATPYPTRTYDGLAGPSAPPATCSCRCERPAGMGCSSPVANLFSDPCTTSCGTPNQVIATTCTLLGLAGCGGTHFILDASVPTGGNCVASATIDVPDAGWTSNVRLCAPDTGQRTSGGCDASQVCAPTTHLPFESRYCVAQAGDAPCPSGYPVKRTYYTSQNDTRTCTPCGCGSPTGASCTGGTVTFYNDTACTAPALTAAVPQACANLGGPKGAKFIAPTPSGGACDASGGAPTGTFTPIAPTTICCTE